MTDISHIILTQICLTAGAYGASARLLPVYFGTYTQNSPSQGIYRSVLDLESGKLSEPSLVAETPNPSFLVIHPNQRFLYCVSEAGPSGVVRAFAVERQTGALSLLNERPSGGAGPCHVSMDQTGRVLLVANYGSGSAAVLPVGADGRLGEPICSVQHKGSSIDPRRQRGPHAHSINVSPDNRFAFVADLGLDKIMVYRLGIDHAKITAHDPAFVRVRPGAGPRHVAFDRQGKFAYVINELDGTVTAFAYGSHAGVLTEIQTISTLPRGFTGSNGCAELCLHPNGQFLYASNRGHDSIAIYRVDAAQGTLSLIEHQTTAIETPRNFCLDPTGRYCLVANQSADTVVVFRVDVRSGQLVPTEHAVSVGRPVCVRFLDTPDR